MQFKTSLGLSRDLYHSHKNVRTFTKKKLQRGDLTVLICFFALKEEIKQECCLVI